MAAKILTVFFPAGFDHLLAVRAIVDRLSLDVDQLPEGSFYDFAAQRREEKGGYILIEYASDAADGADELCAWEFPSAEYKAILGRCVSSVEIHYRNRDVLRQALIALCDAIGPDVSKCVVENGFGVLLLLSDVCKWMRDHPAWTIEREEFPDIPGVARSEFTDD